MYLYYFYIVNYSKPYEQILSIGEPITKKLSKKKICKCQISIRSSKRLKTLD